MFENNSEETSEMTEVVEDIETNESIENDATDVVAETCDEADESTEDASKIEESSEKNDEEMDVDLDEIADVAIDVLQTILKPFDIGDITIDEYEGDDGELILDITGDDLAVLIGRHGRTLDALHFIVGAIVKRRLGYRYPVVVDVEGYKGRQREKLESIARSAANRASSQERRISLHPMTPYERRIVHIALKDDPRVTTESEGEGSDRRVIVIPQQES